MTDTDLAALARALAHPARIQILRTLAARDSCTCGEVVNVLPLAQSTVSQHLKVLADAGLVCGTASGTRVCYCVDAEALGRAEALFSDLFGALAEARCDCDAGCA